MRDALGERRIVAFGVLLEILAATNPASGATSYWLRLRPPGITGLHVSLAGDFSHADTLSRNSVILRSFAHDGTADSAEVDGGPGYGDLFDGANPATETTLEGQYFYNSPAIPFESWGTQASARLELTEEGPAPTFAPDQFALYLVQPASGLAYSTADPLGANALFTIDVTGQPGGELNVYTPMTFVPPDTLALDGAVLDAFPNQSAPGRLAFRAISPNPATGALTFEFEVPSPGGLVRLRVFDVAGRLVAEPLNERRLPGVHDIRWSPRTRGSRRIPAGVYIVQLQSDRQSVVRRVVLSQ